MGPELNFGAIFRLLRTRWIIVCVSLGVCVAAAVGITLLTTPLYQASTKLYVATAGGVTPGEDYNGVLAAQQRAHSYTELLSGQSVARRAIDTLQLDISTDELQSKVNASVAPESVMIDMTVVDSSPAQARDIANAVSDEFVAMVDELEPPVEGQTPTARLVVDQRASLPTSPLTPNPARNLLLGLAVGMLLGVGLALLRELLDDTVRDPYVLEEVAGADLVGCIPRDNELRKNPTITFTGNNSAIAEAFRQLRTNLQYFDVDDPPRVVVVTSPLPSEGRSTTSINFALALAEADQNVALVEGDMRRPKFDKYLNVVGSVGFSTVLGGRASLRDALQTTRFRGLNVLTAGPVPANPSELLGSLSAKSILNELRGAFDYVVIDSAPLLAVTDAAVLAAESDGVLVIARYGKTKRKQLAHGIASLDNVGARILGALVTMTPPRAKESSCRRYYRTSGRQMGSHREDRVRPGSSSDGF